MTWAEDWSAAKNVLCVRLDAMGDVLMTTPAFRALKTAHPGRRLTLLTSRAGGEVARLVPEIDEAIVYDSPWMKATPPRTDTRPDFAMMARLRRGRFDAAAIFTVCTQSPLPAALLCRYAGIPLRLAQCRENPYQLLTHWVRESEPDAPTQHEVRRQLDLAAAVGCTTADERLSLRVPEDALRRTVRLLFRVGLDQESPWVVLHPGASAPSRRYPPKQFAEVARRLVREEAMQVVFTGSAEERPLVEQIREMAETPSISLAGCLDLPELSAVVALTPLLIANNTGPVHLAAALGTPVVVLYALTNPQHTPWAVPCRVLSHEVPCANCYRSVCPEGHQNCLALISPDEVLNAARELLHETEAALAMP